MRAWNEKSPGVLLISFHPMHYSSGGTMDVSRRNLLQSAGAGLALAATGAVNINAASAQSVNASANDTTASAAPPVVVDRKLKIVSLDNLQQEAKKVMTPAAYAFIAQAAGDEWTLRENRRAFNDFPILTHRLAGIAAKDIDLRTDLLGASLPYPIVSAPVGAHTFVHADGEVATAAGVGAAGTLYQSSGASSRSLEDIAKASSGPKWFQLYFNADVGVTRELLQRARAAGYTAIIVTADAIGPGASDAFIQLGRPFPPNFTFGNHDPRYGGRGDFRQQKIDLTPDDIGFIRSVTGLPVIVKGILRAADADVAIRAGASAVQVSNHGGRQIDGVPASITVLREIVEVVAGRVPVIVDGGIRRGIDVFRALALGAQAVAVGRPTLFGLALGGPSGVQSMFEHLRDELQLAMLLAGAKSIKNVSPDYILSTGKVVLK
jgi:lactate oxidase